MEFDRAIRAAIVAEVLFYRESIAALLNRHAVEVVASVSNRAEFEQVMAESVADVFVVDMAVPWALEALNVIKLESPQARAIAFGVDDDLDAILGCAEAGAAGYLTVNASADDLVNAVTRVLADELVCPPRVAALLFRQIAGGTRGRLCGRGTVLTLREREVFHCIKQGLSNKQIASKLHIAEATVKNHIHHLLGKLQVETRSQAAAQRLHHSRSIDSSSASDPPL